MKKKNNLKILFIIILLYAHCMQNNFKLKIWTLWRIMHNYNKILFQPCDFVCISKVKFNDPIHSNISFIQLLNY